jgi:general secretion pathway protein F
MPRFSYTARDASGQTLEANLDAPGRKEAVRLLSTRGLTVVSITEAVSASQRKGAGSAGATGKSGSSGAASNPGRPAANQRRGASNGSPRSALPGVFSRDESPPGKSLRLPFLESLHDLTSSGLSAGEAVRLLSMRIKEPRLRTLCEGLWARLGEGAPLSRAMGDYPAVFDTATLNLIRAGEATGSLNETLNRLIRHLEEQRELRRQLVTALAYPVVMVVASGGVMLFFLFFLLPRLQSLLDQLGGKMPISTQILVGFSSFLLVRGWIVLIVAGLGAASFWRWRSTEAGKETTDSWLLKLPLVGPFVVSQTVLAFSQTLSVLLENGITAAEALRMTARQITNRVHQRAFDGAVARVLEGEALSAALGRTGWFPDLVLDRLAIGENTGNVVPSLKDVARAYQKKISNQLNLFTKVIASSVLMGVFVLVGFIAFAIVKAVFTVSESFKFQ